MKPFKNCIIYLLLLSIPTIACSQNLEIDSILHLIDVKEHEIDDLKHEIVEIIKEQGYLAQAHPSTSYIKEFKILDKPSISASQIGIIPAESEIYVLEKESIYYKIRYRDKIGYLSSGQVKIDDTPMTYVPQNADKKKYATSRSARKKTKPALDYSKPIHVSGHYRTTKSGKRVYVRPHTRKRRSH